MPEFQNLGEVGRNYDVFPSLIGINLFAWVCNRGPFGGGVSPIDNLHLLQAVDEVNRGRSIPLNFISSGSHEGGFLIIGACETIPGDTAIQSYNWVSVLNAPNTGAGGPRGTLSYDRGLHQNPITNGRAGWRFLGVGGQLLFDLFYWEDDSSANGIYFQFVGIPNANTGTHPTTNAVQVTQPWAIPLMPPGQKGPGADAKTEPGQTDLMPRKSIDGSCP